VRYRASINRFWRRNETWDDVFNWGNKHEEMLLAVNTNVMDQNGPVLDNLNSERQVISATWRVAGRVQTGSAVESRRDCQRLSVPVGPTNDLPKGP
jgi:hypothetical protein